MLAPHPWDSEDHRQAILATFDAWFVAHWRRTKQAPRLALQLQRLIEDAKKRHQQTVLFAGGMES